MKRHNTEWISALVDGELHGLRRWWVERHLRRCLVCEAAYRHVRHVRQMLAANPSTEAMTDAAEFFWSKVKREIERRGAEQVRVPVPSLRLADWIGWHAPALATAAAGVIALAVITGVFFARGGVLPTMVMRADTAIPDTVATAIQGEDADVTVIWVSGLPWTPDMTKMKTVFASLDT
jgi:anti-sigma factor RsiW